MCRYGMVLAALTLAFAAAASRPAHAADDEPSLEFGYPLVTRRPVIERELELRINHTKDAAGRSTDVTPALEWPLLPRWQIELSMPFLVNDPREGPTTGGPGDLEIENKFLLFKSLEHRVLVAAGLEVRLPTGSERRGLGGEAAVEPFLSAGVALGDFDLLGSLAYELNVNAHVHGPREQELTASVAALYWPTRRFAPLVELTTTSLLRGDDADLRGRTQVYVTPGFNVKAWRGTTLRFGVELPVTHAKKFDYALRGGLVWEF